jgi:serine/threonine-protein kinase
VPGPRKSHPDCEESLVGRIIEGRYRVDELIARGGMGAVYRGYHCYLKKLVAVKVLRPDVDDLPDVKARFEREAIAGAHVSHPHVAAATDFGKLPDGSFFLVVEHVRGSTLADLIRAGGRLPPTRAARIARQIAAALHAVHALGIVHRDVKSRNVMIADGEEDRAKLIDFGLARVPLDRLSGASPRRSRLDSAPQRITAVGEVFGTVAYLAPEAAFGMDSVDGRSDLYALGVILYEMLAGKRPFRSVDPGDLFVEQQAGPPPIAERSPGARVPAEIEAVARRLLACDPSDRFQTGADVAAALDAALLTTTSSHAIHPVASDPPWAPPARQEGRLVAVMLVALAAATLGAVLLLRGAPRRLPAPTAALASTPEIAPRPSPEVTLPAVAPGTLADEGGAALRLLRAARAHDLRGGARALAAVIDRDPGALRDPEVAAAARDMVVALAADPGGDETIAALGRSAAGADVLYAVVERRGGTRAAARAADLLRRPEVAAVASPALRLAFTLRDAPCADKLDMLDAAALRGDARVLLALETQGRACFARNPRVESAILALRSRLGRR